MGFYNKFNVDNGNIDKPDWLKRITNVFGYLDVEDQGKDRGVAISDAQDLQATGQSGDIIGAQFYGNMRRYINFEEPTKTQKLRVYRQMADYAEIKYALSMITDEMINYDEEDGNVGRLVITNQELVTNLNKKANLKKEWNYIFDDLINFKDTGRDAILSFLVSGELIYEKVSNPDRPGEGLKRVKRLRPDNIFPVWRDDLDSIKYFTISGQVGEQAKRVPASLLAYTSWDSFRESADTGQMYVVSFLEPVKKVWRQLQLLEEAILIYRIVRAPERRVFKVATGNMPRAQAEAYVQKLMRTYRQKKIYNTSTGEIDGQSNIMSMLEDYWFSQPSEGNSTQVDTLASGGNLGEITDLNYFLEKLYRALEIPSNRRIDTPMGDQKYNVGNVTDVSWQEVKFTKLVNNIRRKITATIMDVYKTHLRMIGLWDEYHLKDSDFRLELNKNNYFEEMKKAQVEETRLNAWGTVSTYVGEIFSKEKAVKHFLKWTPEEWEENLAMLEKEKLEGDDNLEGGGPTL